MMVDISAKGEVLRRARAKGKIVLRPETIKAIKEGNVKKGDVFTVSRVAAISAIKRTPETVPLCHPIPITGIDVNFKIAENSIEVEVEVRSYARTGVEMEALNGVLIALLNIWDMVKYLEKDETGNYPTTRIEDVMVVEKVKGSAER